MLGNPSSYAGKKRKKPVPKQKRVSDGNEVKSNPSKRHRDRLNRELDRLTDLLPFSEDIRSRLDKLSVLRLSVGYLRVKNYFSASMPNSQSSPVFPGEERQNGNNTTGLSEGELLLQALNGFVMMVTSEGLVFYVSPTIKNHLGFHQSDVVHQSVFELIHTDDRAMFRQQLHFALNPPTGVDGEVLQSNAVTYSPEQLPPENSSFLERNFVCRFRCLLDNSSGFLALKFQGRLKYLHGQTCLTDNGTCNKPQLAMFAIAMPVNPPSIVEIRAKILLFQTKHKLDFTPMGVDSRGKVILGYSETELCMKGSGYQFIHAADMMYCANNHIRMIKKGETGMTVFRLLSKSSGWVWVKANAKLIFKGGRPEFIIAYQRALDNSEGEEYLRQRRLELPFSFTTGEAILYDTGPSVDISEFQFNKMFNKNHTPKDVTPGSLVDSFLKQDNTVYNQTVNPSLPVDQVFLESRALVSIPSDAWQESGATPPPGARVGVEVESQRSVMTVIDKLAQSSNFCSVLQNLDVSDAELVELENVINGLSSGEGRQNGVSAELDSILSNDIFDYIETVLFKEKEDNGLNGSSPSCLSSVINHQLDPFSQAARLATTGLCEPAQTLSQDCTYAPVNGMYAHQQQDTTNGPGITGQSLAAQMFNNTQKLPHHTCLIAQADANLPPLQHLQLQDIFTPYIELPQIMVPDAPSDDGSAMFQPCVQTRLDCQTQSSQLLLHPPSNLQTPAVAANGQLLQRSVKQPSNVIIKDILAPLIPCSDVKPSRTPNIPIPFSASCLQRNPPLEMHTHQVQQWPQSQQQMLPHAGVMQNGPELAPACHSQTSDSQTFPLAGLWPGGAPTLDHIQQGGLACGQAVTRSSCMFNQHFSYHPAGGDVMALSRSSGLRGAEMTLDQSPPQGSCYFQWSHSEPEVGTSAVNQENISLLAAPSITTSSEHIFNSQHYLEHNRHK